MCSVRLCDRLINSTRILHARIEFLTVILMKVPVFWEFMHFTLVYIGRCFGRACCLHIRRLEPLRPWIWRRKASPKQWHLFTNWRGCSSRKTLPYMLVCCIFHKYGSSSYEGNFERDATRFATFAVTQFADLQNSWKFRDVIPKVSTSLSRIQNICWNESLLGTGRQIESWLCGVSLGHVDRDTAFL